MASWKVHISIAPEDMAQAIPIIYDHFTKPDTPSMGMKIATKGLLAEDHQSGKEIALIFDRATEDNVDGRQKILLFLCALAYDFERARIRPENKPPLTVETEVQVRENGTHADKTNIERGKYDAMIKFRGNDTLSYFNYRDEVALILDDEGYEMMTSFASPEDCQRMVKRSDFNQMESRYKHNPLKRNDDFLYGVILEDQLTLSPRISPEDVLLDINAHSKEDFLRVLKVKLQDQAFTRANILDLFSQIKKRDGEYSYIHEQRHPNWDRIRLFFKSSIPNQKEADFWHTATYQKAVKLLKEAYVARGSSDRTDEDRAMEADAFIDYVRGNSPFHAKQTSTRGLLKR